MSELGLGEPRVTVAVINYNGRDFLDELLHSLREQTLESFDTLLIDNASSDGSADYVRNNFHWVKVLARETNLGFARAGNLAAREGKGEYLALLNTDIRLEKRWLEELVRVADREPDVAAVASKMLLYDRPDHLNGVGGCMNYLGYTWDRGMFEKDRGQYDASAEVLFASAGAALLRRETLLKAGGFDDRFFMYHEDVDLCWRLWLLGHRVVTAPAARVHHHFGGATRESKGMLWRELIGERNNMRALLKNYEKRKALRALRDLLLLRQTRRRKVQQLRNLIWNLRHLPETLHLRRGIQKRRQRSDGDLKYLIVESKHVPIRL